MKKLIREYALSPQLMMPWHPGITVSVPRAADMLGCGETTIYRMIEDGTLEAFKMRKHKPNSPYKIIRDSVLRAADDWRKQTGIQSAPPASSAPAKPGTRR